MQIFSPLHSVSAVVGEVIVEVEWRIIAICWQSVFYTMAKEMVLSVVFHVFYLNMMPFSMPGKLQKGLFFSPVSPNFGRVTRLMNPISLPSTPQNSTSAPLFRCLEPSFLIPQTTIWDVPFYLLGYFKACLCPHIGDRFYPLFPLIFPLSGQKWSTKRMFKPAVERKSDSKPSNNCQPFS